MKEVTTYDKLKMNVKLIVYIIFTTVNIIYIYEKHQYRYLCEYGHITLRSDVF